MHLHPLIHSEFVRQHELDLSRRTLRAPLSSDRARRSLPSKETAVKIGTLTIAIFATLAFTTGAYAATGKNAPHGKSAKSALRASHAKPHLGSVRVVSPRILYFPAPTQAISSTTGNSYEDYCAYYQANCSTSDGSTATPTETDSAPADPATDAVASTDSSATDTTANLAEPQNDNQDC